MNQRWAQVQRNGTKLKGNRNVKGQSNDQREGTRKWEEAAGLGKVVPHNIPKEESRGAHKEQKHADDADESRATRLS